MNLIFTEITTDGKTALLIEGPEQEAYDFFRWCVNSFNVKTMDLWIMKVQRCLLTSVSAETGKVHLPEEPEELEPFYQISYLSAENLVLFRLRWVDENYDIKKMTATTEKM